MQSKSSITGTCTLPQKTAGQQVSTTLYFGVAGDTTFNLLRFTLESLATPPSTYCFCSRMRPLVRCGLCAQRCHSVHCQLAAASQLAAGTHSAILETSVSNKSVFLCILGELQHRRHHATVKGDCQPVWQTSYACMLHMRVRSYQSSRMKFSYAFTFIPINSK
jgi:hypothetical protein